MRFRAAVLGSMAVLALSLIFALVVTKNDPRVWPVAALAFMWAAIIIAISRGDS